jgi:hypothetical protein
MGFQKANHMHYRNLMDTRGESLLQGEDSQDIYSLVKLQRLSEKISEAYKSKPSVELDADPFNDEVKIQQFLGEYQDWRRSTSDFFRNIRETAYAAPAPVPGPLEGS